MHVARYEPALTSEWDAFVGRATPGLFLFERAYLDHHADRFADHSLLLRDARDRLLAVLPANRTGTTLYSHQGLTYGGLLARQPYTFQLIEAFNAVNAYCQAEGIDTIVYKPVPHHYFPQPAQSDLYCLWRLEAILTARNLASVVGLSQPPAFAALRRRRVRKALQHGLTIRPVPSLPAFWALLEAALARQHSARPLHSVAEMEKLQSAFPNAISCWGAFAGEALVAGTLLYETPRVVRAQYIAASPQGQELGALDLLFHDLLTHRFAHKPWFDFGTSNQQQGHVLNHGLVFQKEGFGARGIPYDTYAYSTSQRIT